MGFFCSKRKISSKETMEEVFIEKQFVNNGTAIISGVWSNVSLAFTFAPLRNRVLTPCSF